jgi:predicted glutamine amidotransferase
MCEQFIARAAEPFPLHDLWPLAERMERYGVAGFGWGAAWLGSDGILATHRDTRAFRDDPAHERLGGIETTGLLVHLRRPSRLSTVALPDTQPFADPAGRFTFSHNGDLACFRDARERFRAAGRIHGRADSEVGERWLEDAWAEGIPAAALLARLHAEYGGEENLAVLEAGGAATHYAGNAENPVFTFRLGRIGVASTAIYSLDRSLFRLVAPGATQRALVRPRVAVALDERGLPVTA